MSVSDTSNSDKLTKLKINKFHPERSFQSPAWCLNGHLHTIVSSFFNRDGLPEHDHLVIATPDDDFLELDFVDAGEETPIAILLHGLEGSSNRYYMSQLAETLKEGGISSLSLNFRSCGSHLNRQLRFYHSGETSDVSFVANWLRIHFPNRLLFGVGFSLGGNVLVKWLGEEKENIPISAAVAVSAPYDLETCSVNIEQGFNKVYELRFLQTLIKKANEKRKHYPEIPEFHGKTLREFDDQITSVIHGFKGVDDYYQKASSAPYVKDIRVPTLLVHSREDPICPIDAVPLKDAHHNPYIQTVITEKGGHVGFWSQPPGWLENTILHFFQWFINNRKS
ncbi:MAG TPA: alpha/beta fold hydrolase [Balneolales bacterium]|nr:alpha/beta fold hydrolase [Balneolales bacterium]